MTTTMQNFGLTWIDATGIPRSSAVAYDGPSAERRRKELEGDGATSIEIVPVRPGQLPDPQA